MKGENTAKKNLNLEFLIHFQKKMKESFSVARGILVSVSFTPGNGNEAKKNSQSRRKGRVILTE